MTTTRDASAASVSAETKKKLKSLLAFIATEPRKLDMNVWLTRFNPKARVAELRGKGTLNFKQTKSELPPCGTMGCLAGWAVLQAGLDENSRSVRYQGFPKIAAKLLGLDASQSDRLFLFSYWPLRFHEALAAERRGTKGYLAVVKRRVQSFCRTGL